MLDLPPMSEAHSSPWPAVALGPEHDRVALMNLPGATLAGRATIPPSPEDDGLLRRVL
jgi:hypothetical protein